jgi:superfamily II DNA or RNA helicase
MKVCKAFNDRGIKAKFIVSPVSAPKFDKDMTIEQFIRYKKKLSIHGTYKNYMSKYSGHRSDVINEWENNKFKVLINTGIYTKGYDYKPLETIMVLRATTSETLWLQMIGRGSRINPGKTHFNLLDFGSNAERLGMYRQEREWSLTGYYSNSEGVAPVKECGKIEGKIKADKEEKNGCGALVLASRKICNYCGYIFEKDKIEIDIDLVHIEYSEDEFSKYMGIDFARLERIAEERGYKFGWVINQIIAKGGLPAIEAFQKYKQYRLGWLHRIKQRYEPAIKKYEKKQHEEEEINISNQDLTLF